MFIRTLIAVFVALSLSASPSMAQVMNASWYGSDGKHGFRSDGFVGRRMANGERMNPDAYTIANWSIPLGTRVCLTDPATGRKAVARVTDRGPGIRGRKADMSFALAKFFGKVLKKGTMLLDIVEC